MKEFYDADYFLRGRESGKSLYDNYRWLPELTIPMVQRIVGHCGIEQDHRILDFGCARGYIVKAFRELGFDAYGYDVSDWAIQNADEDVRQYLFRTMDTSMYDWVIVKDVLEHVSQLWYTIPGLMGCANVGVFAVVPLANNDMGEYVISEYEKDITHVHRLTLGSWASLFMRHGWEVTASYRVKGIKDNYADFGTGNGFITARRIKE